MQPAPVPARSLRPVTTSRIPLDVRRVLAAAESASPVDAVPEVARELALALGAVRVSFLISDASGRGLVRLAHTPLAGDDVGDPRAAGRRHEDEEAAAELPYEGGPAEQAMRTQTVQVLAEPAASGAARWRVLAPVTERGEAIGLLELYLPGEPSSEVVSEIGQVAHVLAFVVIANRGHTDLYEWGQRSQAYSLSAEIQQRLLPPSRTCEAAAFTLAGWLEPAATIGGDTYDYSLARDLLHLSLTDAMGHGVQASLTASMCLGSLRGARRRGLSLLEQAKATNDAILQHPLSPSGSEFASGLVGRLDLRTGSLEIVNAGHIPPYLLRDGRLTTLDLAVDPPFGMFAESTYRATQLSLTPGDRLVFVTDGMLERNPAGALLAETIRDSDALHPRELVRHLADNALEAAGHALLDDATVLCLDWHGMHEEARDSVAGAEPARASAPLGTSGTSD